MIPLSEFRRRLHLLRDIMDFKGLKSVLIYGAPGEDIERIRWLLGTNTNYPTYLLITDTEEVLFEARWLAEDIKERTRIKRIVPIADMEDAICKMQNWIHGGKIGIVGLIPYHDLQRIRCKYANITEEYTRLMLIKSSYEIKMVREACKIFNNSLKQVKIGANMKEYEIAAAIETSIKNKGFKPSLPTSVIGGKRLAITTYGTPTDNKLRRGDLVCIDGGVCVNTYNSDITRCLTIGGNGHFKYYERLVKVQESLINQLQIGDNSLGIVDKYKRELKKYNLDKYLVPYDMGHGIGCGHHEPPNIGEDNYKIEENMIFTLEPELNLGKIKLRIEDVILAKKHGMVKLSA